MEEQDVEQNEEQDVEQNQEQNEEGDSYFESKQQVAVQRKSRTINKRQSVHPTIAKSMSKNSKPRPILIGPGVMPLLQPATCLKRLKSDIDATVIEYVTTLISLFNSKPNSFTNLLESEEFPVGIIEVLANNNSETVLTLVLYFLGLVFPNCDSAKQRLIDEDLVNYLTNFLSTGSPPLKKSTIDLLPILVDNSSYARDSILCFDILNILCGLAKTEEFGLPSCLAIERIFTGSDEIDSDVLSLSVHSILELLELPDNEKLQSITAALVEICDRKPSLILSIVEKQKYSQIISFLKVQSLINQGLSLISLIVNGYPPSLTTLIENGVIESLFEFLGTEYAANVYFVFAYMVENSPLILLKYFSEDFLKSTIDVALSSSLEVQQGAVYFLATVIKFSPANIVKPLVNNDTFEILSEMLSGEDSKIILQCLDAFIRICQILHSSNDTTMISEINKSYLSKPLENLISHESYVVSNQANSLQKIMEGVSVPVLF